MRPLGRFSIHHFFQPRLVESLEGVFVELVAAGGDQTVVSSSQGDCFFFGWSGHTSSEKRVAPSQVARLRGLALKEIAVGLNHVVVCTRQGDLWAWGCNQLGQLGLSVAEDYVALPTEVDAVRKVATVAAGHDCSACVTLAGSVMFWGDNWVRSKPGTATRPFRIPFSRSVATLALGKNHMVAVGRLGEVWAVGSNDFGQLGVPKVQTASQDPVLVTFRNADDDADSFAAASAASAASSSGTTTTTTTTLSTMSTGSSLAPGATSPVLQRENTSSSLLTLSVDASASGSGGVVPAAVSPPALGSSSNADLGTAVDSPAASHAGAEKLKGMWGRLFSKESVTHPMERVACGVNFTLALSKSGQVYTWGTEPASKTQNSSPVLVAALAQLCIGTLSCGSVMSACTVDLQNTADLQFHSYAPPILRAATPVSALEFLFSSKGAASPLLDFIMHTMWPTFCDEADILHALDHMWTAMVDDVARQRFQRFVLTFVQENAARAASSPPFQSALRELLVAAGQDLALKQLTAAVMLRGDEGAPAPALRSTPSSDAVLRNEHRKLSGGRGSSSPHTAPAVDLLQYTPETIAEQLMIIDHRVLLPVTTKELMTLAWTKKDKEQRAPGVLAVSARFNAFADFVRSDIVMHRDSALRARHAKMWIDVQKQCFNLSNFNAVMALSAALNSVPVRKLMRVDLLEVSRSHRRWLDFVDDSIVSRNMRGYRTKFSAAVEAREAAVPFMATHLGDLVFIHEGNPDTLEGGLVNMWKRYQLARQLSAVRQMQEISNRALKVVDELYRYLSTVTPALDERKCDEVVEALIAEAEATQQQAGANISAPVPVSSSSSSTAWSTATPSSGAASARAAMAASSSSISGSATAQLDAALLERLRHEGEAEPDTRLGVWNMWVQTYVAQREDFLRAWCRSGALEACVRGLLAVPLTPPEEPVFETLCAFFLVKGVDVRRLIELLRLVALSDPPRETCETMVALVASFKHTELSMLAPQPAPPASGAIAAATSLAQAFELLDKNVRSLVVNGAGPATVSGGVQFLLRTAELSHMLRRDLTAPTGSRRAALSSLVSQRDTGKKERNAALLCADAAIRSSHQALAAIKAKEDAMRAQLNAIVAERMRIESEVEHATAQLSLTSQQQNQRIEILNVNIEHAEHEIHTAERALAALDMVQESGLACAEAMNTRLRTLWTHPLDERVAELEQFLFRLEDSFLQLQLKLRASRGAADPAMLSSEEVLRGLLKQALDGPYAALFAQITGLSQELQATRKGRIEQLAVQCARLDALSRELHNSVDAGSGT